MIAPARLAWADVARGGAMVLVVLAHVLQLMGVGGWSLGWLDTANLYLTAIRMPLFFLIAGLFAASAITRTWGGLWRSRLALLVYVYLVWSVIRALWFSVVPWPLGAEIPPWLALLLAPVWPTSGLWFLFALVLYLVLARASVRVPAAVVLGGAGALSLLAAANLVPTGGNGVWRSVAMYLFFFVLGARLPTVWRAWAARPGWAPAVAGVAVIPVAVLLYTLSPAAIDPLARVLLSTVCVAACLPIAAAIARVGWLAAPLLAVGRRTLPIYVTHTLLLAVLVPLVPVGLVPAALAAGVLTAAAVLLSLGLFALLGRFGGIYSLPGPWARSLAARDEPPLTPR